MSSNFPVGRFILVATVLEPGMDEPEEGYVTSFDTWEEAQVVWGDDKLFPVGFKLIDDETGRVWYPGTKYEWEEAQT